jgi:WD40 repeat protein
MMQPLGTPHSDNLFIGGSQGRLLQWSIRQKKIVKDYG